MKLCQRCGAHNRNDRFFCIDCDERLGDSLSPEVEQELARQTAATTEKLYNRGDPLHRTVYDTVVGIAAAVGMVVFIAVGIALLVRQQGDSGFWLAPLLLTLGGVEALVPSITWTLEKWRLSWYFNSMEDATPGPGYKSGRILSETLLTAMGLAVVVLMMTTLF